jgi:RND family efflux transporter MFP subunit
LAKLATKTLLPAAVLVGSLAASAALVVARPVPEPAAPSEQRPVVAVVPALPSTQPLRVRAQGTVEPRTEVELVAEVAGRLAWVSPALESGGFFAAGEVLARIDAADYEIALARARAALERTRSQRKLADAALRRARALRQAGAASAAALDQADANAAMAAAGEHEAEAALRQAELELARTETRAPFAGRVRERSADAGQLLGRGARLASVFAVDFAEVRLPIPSEELAFLVLPKSSGDAAAGPAVRLTGSFAGRTHTWHGRIVRAEGVLDPRTRLVHVVARVEDPYGLASAVASEAPALEVGLFVEAEIEGRAAPDAVRLPRSALRGERDVVVLGGDGTLHARRVEVLRVEGEEIVVAAGLAAGERVVARVPSAFTEGMRVRVAEAPADARALPAMTADPALRAVAIRP